MNNPEEINEIFNKLNKMSNQDILKKEFHNKTIIDKLEEIVSCYKEADKIIHILENLKNTIINNLEYLEKNEIKLINPKLLKDADKTVKNVLIKRYMETHKKYFDLEQYYSAIDTNYYNLLLTQIINSIF
jgi:hypothetical protein